MNKFALILGAVVLTGLPAWAGPTPGGLATDNVEYVSTVPFDAGSAIGARRVGDHLYVSSVKHFSIYDVTDPLSPQLLSITPVGVQAFNEDVDTNGKVLLFMEQTPRGILHVWDVSDKAQPTEVGTLQVGPNHTMTCVLECRYAWGAAGTIIDLKDPSRPRIVSDWRQGGPLATAFDLTEVSPGLVLATGQPITLFDARKNALHPRVVAFGGTSDNRLLHSNRWPNHGLDHMFLVQSETPFSLRCDGDSGAIETWDASAYRRTHTFSPMYEYRVQSGTAADGSPPVNVIGCTALWFDEHPDYRNGGYVAAGFLEHGTRFLSVARNGKISEAGYFMPYGGSTSAAYWLNDEIVYAIDFDRGIDILRFIQD